MTEPAEPSPSEMPSEPRSPASTWPKDQRIEAKDGREAQCRHCGRDYVVHKNLCGFRFRCDCDQWVDVPPDAQEISPPILTDAASVPAERTAARRRLEVPVRDERGLVHLQLERGEVYEKPIPTSLPMAPGSLQAGGVEWRARWTTVALLELTAVLAAILLPHFAAMLLAEGREATLLMPFASLVGGIGVFTIAAVSGPYGTIGLRRPKAAALVEALGAAAAMFVMAIAWCELLATAIPEFESQLAEREILDRLGLELTLLVVAVSPAIVEEIAFRGMLQGRLMALLGARQGLLVTAMAFTLVHMSPATMPIHLGLGLYLGWLRERSGSLLPGMLTHFAYNTAIVLYQGAS